VGEEKHYFLARSGRSSYAPPPGPRTLCELGLAAFFFFFGRFLSWLLGPSAKHCPLPGGERESGRGQKLFLGPQWPLELPPPPGPRALCEMGLPAWSLELGPFRFISLARSGV
jgi:hypothetical protein